MTARTLAYALPGTSRPARSRQPLGRPVGAVLASLLALSGCAIGDTGTPTEPAADLVADLEEFLAIRDDNDMVRAILIYRDGEPVLEQYPNGGSPDLHLDTRSITKNYTATLIGIAIDRGEIAGVDATLGELLPSYADVLTPDTAGITLHEVLTHTAGLGIESPGNTELQFWNEPDWVRSILTTRAERGPWDGAFVYTDAGAQVLSAILVEATGVPMLDFARENLFEPLGIESEPAWTDVFLGDDHPSTPAFAGGYAAADFAWPVDPQGMPVGGFMLKQRAADLVTLGLLHLQDGVWEGERIVSTEWIAEATATQVETGDEFGDYGYSWWTREVDGERAFAGSGHAGNVIFLIPGEDLEIVVMSEWNGFDPADQARQFAGAEDLLNDILLPALGFGS